MTSAAPAEGSAPSSSPRDTFLRALEREHATTVRVLRAYPPDKLDLKPHPRSKSARELAFLFIMEQVLAQKAMTTGFDWSTPPAGPPPAPEMMDEIIAAFEQGHAKMVERVREMTEEELGGTARFFVAPKTLGDIPMME
ncbi:MAG TPA: DinB family protein, partial [Longimicrobium sp.]